VATGVGALLERKPLLAKTVGPAKSRGKNTPVKGIGGTEPNHEGGKPRIKETLREYRVGYQRKVERGGVDIQTGNRKQTKEGHLVVNEEICVGAKRKKLKQAEFRLNKGGGI